MQTFNQDLFSVCFEDFWTPYPLTERLTKKVHMMLSLEGLPRAPCMICYVPGGGGKTAFAQELHARSQGWAKKLMMISMQEDFQNLDLEASILSQLALPTSAYGFIKSRTFQIRSAISRLNIGGVIIDDIHELLRFSPEKQRSSMLFLKGLACDGLSICAFGSRDFQRVFKVEPHLSKYWLVDNLPPFGSDGKLKSFLEEYSRNFRSFKWSCFDAESVSIIHKKTHGLIDNVVKVVQVLAANASFAGEVEVQPHNVKGINLMLDMFNVRLGELYD